MAVSPISWPTANISSLADFSPLAKLGDVYRAAQTRDRQLSALGQLGTDQAANAAVLTKSGDPTLAMQGINLQNTLAEQQRAAGQDSERQREFNVQQAIRNAQESRAAQDWQKKGTDEEAAARAVAALFGQQAQPPQAAPAAPQTNWGPVPSIASQQPAQQPTQQPVSPQAVAQSAAPPVAAAAPVAPPAAPLADAPPVAPSAFTSPIAPSQLATTSQSAAAPDITSRIASNLTSGQPAATAGISRDQIADLYRNPITRPLATAFLQKQFDPGSWKYEKTEDGRIIATSSNNPNLTKDVTPPLPNGQAPMTKQEREVQGNYNAAINQLGMNPQQATAFAANGGKMPKDDDLSPTDKKRVATLTDQVRTAQNVLDNINQLKTLSKNAWGFTGAGPASLAASTVLPSGLTGGAVDTQDLINAAHTNVAQVAKTVFPQRVTNTDLKLLNEIESSADQPDAVRQRVYTRGAAMIQRLSDEASAEMEGIRNKTFYKPGGGTAPAPRAAVAPTAAPAAPAAPATARPSLGDFMTKARAANPGWSDSELAAKWKERYGS